MPRGQKNVIRRGMGLGLTLSFLPRESPPLLPRTYPLSLTLIKPSSYIAGHSWTLSSCSLSFQERERERERGKEERRIDMGNCIDHQKAASWLDDDEWEYWAESPTSMHCSREEKAGAEVEEKKGGFLEGKGGVASTEVKLKITKKQLKELLQKVEGKGLSIQQVLADLLSMPEATLQERAQHWRPALQSIPESPTE